jgi:hypothetical protein
MHLVQGNLWDELGKADLILVTTNGVLKADGELVMGAGVAKQAACKVIGLPKVLGHQIKLHGRLLGSGTYSYLLLPGYCYQGSWIGAFQSKFHWQDSSPLDLIKDSVYALGQVAPRFTRIAMAFPGIGHGGLRKDQVLPILETLPDNVYVYTRS